MRVKIMYSPSNDAKEAYNHLANQLNQVDFEPNFLLLFLTGGTWKNYNIFTELFKKKFPHAKMLGCTVEGYLVKDEVWMRGVAAILGEFDGKVEVFWAREKNATRTVEKLGEQIGKGWDAILLMFPIFYFPGKFDLLKFFFNDKRYYRAFVKSKEINKRKKILEEYSKYLDNKKMSYPINTTLKIISERTGGSTPIIGMTLLPLEASSYTPLILANYKNVKNGAAAMCFKGDINPIFHDVFPERGGSYEETFEIIKKYFPETEEVRIIKGGMAIGEINGLRPIDFLKVKKCGLKDVTQDEFLKKIEKGKQLVASPYIIAFISKRTFGSTFLGLINSPLSLYPTAFDVADFYDRAAFAGEIFRGGIKTFGEIFDAKKFNGFDFLIIDWDTIMSFGGDVHKLAELIKEKSKTCFGVFSCPPSAYIPNPNKKYLSEIENRVCVNLTGTSIIVEFK